VDTIGDKSFEDLGLTVLKGYQRPISPDTVDYTTRIPGQHGAWDFGADLSPREFWLPCILKKQTPAALQEAINTVSDHFYDATGRPKTLDLVFGDEPEKTYRVRIMGGISISRIIGTGQFTLPLVAFDPFSYAPSTAYDPVETYEYDSGLQYDSGLMYDNVGGFDWRYSKQYVGLYNYSGIETPVRLVVNGTVINPRVTNQTTGEILTVGGSTENLTIDSKSFYVEGTKITQTSIQELDDFFFLSSGFPIKYKNVTRTKVQKYFIVEQSGIFVYLAPGKTRYFSRVAIRSRV
jgi:predicted phage tail component-like protein